MKPSPKSILLIVLFALFSSSPALAQRYQVDQVVSADSLKVDSGGKKLIVRLAGIDAPKGPTNQSDPGQPFYKKAMSHLAGLVQYKTVYVKSYGSDESGRLLAEVFVRDRNINVEMLKAGFAEVYRGEQPKGLDLELYRKAEKEAKAANRGMWIQGAQYVSPWDWRGTHPK